MLQAILTWIKGHHSVASILADFHKAADALENLAERKLAHAGRMHEQAERFFVRAVDAHTERREAIAVAGQLRELLTPSRPSWDRDWEDHVPTQAELDLAMEKAANGHENI